MDSSANSFRRQMHVFEEACRLPAPQRMEFLARECGDDPDLRASVESMLAHDATRAGFVGTAVGGERFLAACEAVGEAITGHGDASSAFPRLAGQYRIIKTIGQGGMGTVYEAEQAIPKRSVALKAIRAGSTSPEMVKRFEHEAHILGRLHHPGIAQIYEAAFADRDHGMQAFIAMELVNGCPLTEFARSNNLDIAGRIDLIIRICDGVQHAHQRGIIHRDLKPTNILVTEKGEPKILDFGVARAVGADHQMTTMHTVSGQLVGTLPYMSPEQVSGDPDEVDTRSDVYAIGVILYELLVGHLPFDFSKLSLPDAARVIASNDPPPIGTINRQFRGEIETIVSKALSKDKTRRYQSAGDVGNDLRHHLAGEPIEARRDSTLYLLRKSMRRHRLAMAVAAGFVLLAASGSIALGVSYRRQGALLIEVEQKRVTESAARKTAERESAKATAVNEFVRDMLASADPNITQGKEPTVRELLDRAAAEIDGGSLSGQPDIEAAVRYTVGETYRSLSLYSQAEIHLRKALALQQRAENGENLDAAATMTLLASILRELGQAQEAMDLNERSMEIFARHYGKKELRYAQGLTLRADLLQLFGRDYAGAEAAYRESIEICDGLYGRKNIYNAATLGNLGAMLLALFRRADAEVALREGYEIALAIEGPDHHITITNANNLASLLYDRFHSEEAEAIARPALAGALRIFGPDHVATSRLERIIALIALEKGDIAEAEDLARKSLAARQKTLPRSHFLMKWSVLLVAESLAASGEKAKADEAIKLVREILETSATSEAPSSWVYDEARSILGAGLAVLGNADESEKLLLESYEKIKTAQGASSRPARSALKRIIKMYETFNNADRAAHHRALLDVSPSSTSAHPGGTERG